MKKLLIFAIFAGVLAYLVLFVLPRVPRQEAVARKPQPSPWNSGTVQGTFSGVQVREVDPAHATLEFFFDLDNNTDTDYRLTKGASTVVMTRLKSDGTLRSDEAIELDGSVFLPARNRTRIAVQIARPFNWPAGLPDSQIGPINQVKFRQLVSDEVANLSGFVVFDQVTHFQIELPGGWQELQPSTSAASLN
jgi:hypothetical protein